MRATPTARAPWALLAAFAACLLFAMADRGATDLPAQSWLQLALAVVTGAALVAWLYGNGLSLRLSRAGLAGVALLALFAVWVAASIAWSVAPDRSWADANNAIAYLLAAVAGALVGSSLPRATQHAGMAIALVTLPIALYALGGKALPALDLGPLSLDHTSSFNRLRAPLGYWNALALACVTGMLPLLRAAADPWRAPLPRIGALLGVHLLAVVLGMTYSRGGLLALVVGAAVLVALGTERVRTLLLLLAAAVAAAPPLTIALGRSDLTTDFVPLGERTDDGVAVLVAFLLCAALLAACGRALIALEGGTTFTAARGRAVGRPLARAVAAAAAVALVVALATGAGGRAFDEFADVRRAAALTDPNRLVSGNSGNRWVWWSEAAGAWSDRPVAGWGAGSFGVTHLLYRKEVLSVLQPHSVPLQWLAETGVVGFILAACALLALLAAGLARVRGETWALRHAPPERGAAAALLAVAAAWVVHSLFEWSWDIPAITLPTLFALGVLAARLRREAARPSAVRGPATAAVAVAFVLIALSALLPALARTRTDAALAAAGSPGASASRLEDAAAQADLAARLNPLATEPLVAAATIALRRGRTEEARDYLLRAVRRNPYDVEAWTQLARLEFERGDLFALRRAAQEALELDPLNGRVTGLALRAAASVMPPEESATATGTPLPTRVPLGSAPAVPAPSPTPTPTPSPAPTPDQTAAPDETAPPQTDAAPAPTQGAAPPVATQGGQAPEESGGAVSP